VRQRVCCAIGARRRTKVLLYQLAQRAQFVMQPRQPAVLSSQSRLRGLLGLRACQLGLRARPLGGLAG
jgi:hypothetical protein